MQNSINQLTPKSVFYKNPELYLRMMLATKKLSPLEKILYLNTILLSLKNYELDKKFHTQNSTTDLSKMLNTSVDPILQVKKKLKKKNLLKIEKTFSKNNIPKSDIFFPQIRYEFFNTSVKELFVKHTPNLSELYQNFTKMNSKILFNILRAPLNISHKVIAVSLVLEAQKYDSHIISSSKQKLINNLNINGSTLHKALEKLTNLKMLEIHRAARNLFEIKIGGSLID